MFMKDDFDLLLKTPVRSAAAEVGGGEQDLMDRLERMAAIAVVFDDDDDDDNGGGGDSHGWAVQARPQLESTPGFKV